jgi:acyl-coenzyme A thioesterase PaaI-like protein
MIYQKFPKKLLFALWRFWPPFLGAGISIQVLSEDLMHTRAHLKLRWWNKNYVGTQYGGSLFSMTDAIYMVMLMQNLGSGYIVWDKAASIRYLRPGKTHVTADYKLTPEILDSIRRNLETQPTMDWNAKVEVKDQTGQIIAEVDKVLYIRKKALKREIPQSPSK